MTKATLITGAAKGLGKELSKELAKKRECLILHYNTSERQVHELQVECSQFGCEVKVVKADFSTKQGLENFLSYIQTSQVEIVELINNVGVYFTDSFMNTELEDLVSIHYSNLFTPFAIIKSLIQGLKANRGSIVNVGTAGLNGQKIDILHSAYQLTKQSLYFLTRSLAKELAPFGVRVNMVSPGVMVNSVTVPADKNAIPMGRLAELEEVVRAVMFLLDPNNHYITGQNIEVAGGYGI